MQYTIQDDNKRVQTVCLLYKAVGPDVSYDNSSPITEASSHVEAQFLAKSEGWHIGSRLVELCPTCVAKESPHLDP